MKIKDITPGIVYSNGKGKTRTVLDAGRHVINPQFRHADDTDNVLYEDGKGNKGIMTRRRFASWAKLVFIFVRRGTP